jgi:hypothetical protein
MTNDQKQEMVKLYQEYGLSKEDVFTNAHYKIFTRSGIEKMQYASGIDVQFTVVRCEPDFAAVKAVGRKGDEIIETFGSSVPSNTRASYYLEIAEKRALARVVLKMLRLYELGFNSEDEADEFKDHVRAAKQKVESVSAEPDTYTKVDEARQRQLFTLLVSEDMPEENRRAEWSRIKTLSPTELDYEIRNYSN